MEEFGLPTKTRTKDGYNPLLDDFKNTKFYLSVPTHNTKQTSQTDAWGCFVPKITPDSDEIYNGGG